MIPFFKKDFLVYWRDRKEIIISLITPIVIITVLGFALPGWIENPAKSLAMTAAVVHLDDESAALEQFRDSLAAQNMPEEAKQAIGQQLEQMSPVGLLMQLLQNEAVKEIVTLKEPGNEEALRQLKEGQIDAVITIPEGYTLAALNKMLLNKGEGAALHLKAEKASMSVDVLSNIIDDFLKALNFQSAVRNLLGENAAAAAASMDGMSGIGGRETVPGVRIVTAFQYYALAISIVFSLFIALTTASKAMTEKRERTFQRILLTGSRRYQYLSGKMSSTFCMSILQLGIILLVSHFILNIFPDRSLSFWLGISVILIMLAVVAGALAGLYTALVFRMEDTTATGIAFIATFIAGTIGGSFVPIFVLPEWIQTAGEWTPNGLTLAVSMEWLQTETAANLALPLAKLALFTIATAALALWCFPKRGRI